jgi:uncharacterized protein YndB with AHSA1/START domain
MSEPAASLVSVSRRIPAPAAAIFAVLADPTRHAAIDGSGMLRSAVEHQPVSKVGDVFAINMHNDDMGDYEMSNHVVEFEPGRRIAWEPVMTKASRPEDESSVRDPALHRWGFELAPVDGGQATVVTETFDCTRSPEWLLKVLDGGRRWEGAMTTTLEKLDAICAQG